MNRQFLTNLNNLKKILLCVILFLSCTGILFAQKKSANNIEKITARLENIGTVPGSISEYFTAEEIVILQNHFNNKREDIEVNFISEKRLSLATMAYTTNSTEFGSFELPSGEITVISANTSFINAGVINPNDPTEAFVLDNIGDFYSIDVATGVYTSLGSIPGGWLGAEVNPVTGIMYAIADDMNLYSIDTSSISATLIGDTGVDLLIALAIDGLGNAYSYSVLDDNLYSINLSTGASTLIGSIGFDANFGQGMFWHTETDTVYMTAFNNTIFDAELRSVNTITGETTFISILGSGGSLEQYSWASSDSSAPGPDPLIYNTWYLSEMWVDEGDTSLVIDVEPPISPNFTIEPTLEYYGDGACNGYLGTFIYNNQTDNFSIETFTHTLSICDYESHDDFEGQFFSYFSLSDTVDYSIFEYGNDQILTLEFIPGFELVFQDTPVLKVIDLINNTVKISPNPVSNTLLISSGNTVIKKMVVYSIFGKLILEQNNNQDNSIDVSSLSKGMYFLELTSETGKTVKKFIKK